jgi:glucosamine-6-phosphate deaminase
VGKWVANYIAKRINDFAPTAERPFVLGLPTGSSPMPTYEVLLQRKVTLSLEYAFGDDASVSTLTIR